MQPDAVMIFAAGFGNRMGALTADRPKPMIEVTGKPLIDHALDLADAAGVSKKVVNTHYLPEILERHLAGRSDVKILREEPEILDTGGGLKNALPSLGTGPVFTLNSDAIWTGDNPLTTLSALWDATQMDALLLLIPRAQAQCYAGPGDFLLQADGRLARGVPNQPENFVYSGAQIIRTDLLKDIPGHSFSLNLLWNALLERRTAYGAVHSGGWVDVGTPQGIDMAEKLLRQASDV